MDAILDAIEGPNAIQDAMDATDAIPLAIYLSQELKIRAFEAPLSGRPTRRHHPQTRSGRYLDAMDAIPRSIYLERAASETLAFQTPQGGRTILPGA